MAIINILSINPKEESILGGLLLIVDLLLERPNKKEWFCEPSALVVKARGRLYLWLIILKGKKKRKNYKDKESFVWGQIVGNNAHNRIVGAYLKCKGVEAIKK